MERITRYRDLRVYQSAISSAMEIFRCTQSFPVEERYSLTDQIRRSSRSVCSNIAEAWRKRRYKAAFVAKLNDAEAEACETQVWVEIAMHCGYLSKESAAILDDSYDHIISQLVLMEKEPDKWIIR